MRISSAIYLIKEGLKNLWSNRTMTLATIIVFVCCLLLSGGAVITTNQINNEINKLQAGNLMMVYLKTDVSTLQSVKLRDDITAMPNVNQCDLITKDEALIDIIDNMENGESILGGLLEDNPLPNAFRVTVKDTDKFDKTKSMIEEIDGVDIIRGENKNSDKIIGIKNAISASGFWIVLILLIVSFFIMINTIKITMYARQKEISIMKSVGATDFFIKVPFIVEGIIIGLISGLTSWFVMKYLYESLSVEINMFMGNVMSPFDEYSQIVLLGYLVSGVIFGTIGGIVSIGKFLKECGGESNV